MSNSDTKLYLYENNLDLVFTTDQYYVDNRTMDTRNLKAHKGVTNDIIFTVRNRDRKLQNVSASTVRAHIVDPSTRQRVVTRQMDNTLDTGKLKLTIQPGDIQNLKNGMYFVYLDISTDELASRPLYTDQNNNMRFNIDITDQAGADPVPTQTQNTFLQTSSTNTGDEANVFVTNALAGNLDRNFPDALHSMAFILDGYTGNIKVQGSCLSSVPDTEDLSTDWFTIDTLAIADANTTIKHTSFNVNANWIRVVNTPDTGTITQVQLRN